MAMIGKGSFIPGIIDGNIATDSSITHSEAVKLHFERIDLARKSLLEADSNRRIKEALSARAQRYMDRFYKPGERVFFLDERKKWQGPATTGESENQAASLPCLDSGSISQLYFRSSIIILEPACEAWLAPPAPEIVAETNSRSFNSTF